MHSETFCKDHEKITPFQALLLVKVLKQEFTVEAMNHYIKESIGEAFVDASSPTMQ